jgi:FAD/FMN-containing dehydrogenase
VRSGGRRDMVPSAPDWEALQLAVSGDVVLPGSPDYESTRKPAIANFHDIRPQAVVLCRTPQDVSETILFARESGLRTAARSGGHCFAGRSSTEGIIVDVTPMRSVSVSDGVATVGAGARTTRWPSTALPSREAAAPQLESQASRSAAGSGSSAANTV